MNAAELNAADLIRTIDDVEVPTTGRWTIAGRQPVTLHATTGWRRRARHAVASGALIVAEDPLDSTFSLTLDPADGPRIDVHGRLVETHPLGAWRVDGTVARGDATEPITCDVRYHGVYRHGGRATAWLTVRAVVPAGRRGASLELAADLNAERDR